MCPKCASCTCLLRDAFHLWNSFRISMIQYDLIWFHIRFNSWLMIGLLINCWFIDVSLSRSFSFVILNVVRRPTGLSFTWRRRVDVPNRSELTIVGWWFTNSPGSPKPIYPLVMTNIAVEHHHAIFMGKSTISMVNVNKKTPNFTMLHHCHVNILISPLMSSISISILNWSTGAINVKADGWNSVVPSVPSRIPTRPTMESWQTWGSSFQAGILPRHQNAACWCWCTGY